MRTYDFIKDLGKEDITTTATYKGRTFEIDWLDFGCSIITAPNGNGREVIGSFSWKRDSAEEIYNAILRATEYQVS